LAVTDQIKINYVYNMKLKFSLLLALLATPSLADISQAANPAHLSQLASGKQCNNCDLSMANLSGQDLSGFQLIGANLNGANLVNTNLSGANLTQASIVGANLAGANLSRTNLNKATFVYSNLARVQMQGATLLYTDLQGANLADLDMSGAQVSKSSFTKANIYGLKLPSSMRANAAGLDANGNTFTISTLKALAGEGGASRTITTTEGGVDVYEAGGSSRRRRQYSVPLWMSTTQRSTVGASQFYNPNNPDIRIELW
jgi:uncharacterized protein YjbI with pentapeptide repeats